MRGSFLCVTVAAMALVGCDGATVGGDGHQEDTKVVFIAPGTYKYYQEGKSDPNCKEDDDNKCADAETWEMLCKNTSQVLPEAESSMISYVKYGRDYDALQHITNNKGVVSESVEFSKGGDPYSSCKVNFEIDGIYQGSEIRQSISGYATEMFVVPRKTDDGRFVQDENGGRVVIFAGVPDTH